MSGKWRSKLVLASVLLPALFLLHTGCDKKSGEHGAQAPVPHAKAAEQYADPMVSPLLKRAEWAMENGAYTTALAICDQLDKRVPNFAHAYFLRGQTLTNLNRHDEARTAFEKAQTLDPNFPAIRFTLGNNAAQRKQFREALKYYEAERAAMLPDTPLPKQRAILLQTGRAHKELGEIDKARAAFQQVVVVDENFAEGYAELGQIYQEEGELEKALAAQMHALELQLENGDYSYYVGALLVQLGRPSDAVAHLEKAKAQRPWFHGVYYHLGRSLIAMGRKREGERYLALVDSMQARDSQLGVAKTNAEQQDTPEKWMRYADMLYHDKRYMEALETYQVAQYLNPRDSLAVKAVLKTKRVLAVR